jgi:hypothetical protein
VRKTNYHKLQEKYGGMFVAYPRMGGRVVAAGKTASELFRRMKKKGIYRKPHAFEYIAPKNVLCAF